MAHILLMEGNTIARLEEAAAMGVRSASEVYRQAVLAHFPSLDIDIVCAADRGQTPPNGRAVQDYDALIIGGSGLHAYDTDFAVTNQIEMVRSFATTAKPILGSCWGLQIAVVAAGGAVDLNPKGREVLIARKLQKIGAGLSHPFLRGRRKVYDAPCIHYDEVTELPSAATVLCHNYHSAVQGAIVPLDKSEIWAVQYHPEFDIEQLYMLTKLYGEDLIAQGFFEDTTAQHRYMQSLAKLRDNPNDKAIAWQLGFDENMLNDTIRRTEIIAWIENCILT